MREARIRLADYRTGAPLLAGGATRGPPRDELLFGPLSRSLSFSLLAWANGGGGRGPGWAAASAACLLTQRARTSIDRSSRWLLRNGGWSGVSRNGQRRPPPISLYFPLSHRISLHLPLSPRISRTYFSSRISYLPVCGISRYCNFAVSRGISPYLAVFRRGYREKKRPRQGFMTMSPIARRRSQPAAGLSSEGPAAAAARPAADTPSPLRCCRAWRRRRSASSCLSQTGLFLKFLRGESQRDVCVPMIWCGEKTIPWMPCRTVHAGSGS